MYVGDGMDSRERYIAARRAVIENYFKNLNNMQRKAVLSTQGPLLVLAGAGSGKTTVLINRIANLILFGQGYESEEIPYYVEENDVLKLEDFLINPQAYDADEIYRLCAVNPVAPWSIIAITFTNKAAEQLKTRLNDAVGERGNDVWASTFHSACLRILRRDVERLGYQKSFTIYDTNDSTKLVKNILKDMEIDEKHFPVKNLLRYFGMAKDKMIEPRDFFKEFSQQQNDYFMEKIAAIYAEYQRRLVAANAMDFDDIILNAVRLLQYDDVRDFYQNKFRYVLIDEYQDTNHLQYVLASTLAGKWGNICVVGDDDQSIYRFRGATIENILSFEEQYKNTRVIKLEQNYRSYKNILGAANSVIDNNKTRKSKKLWTDNADGDKIKFYKGYSEDDEASFIASEIINGKRSFKDHAVLYRMNVQSNRIEEMFKRNAIPYRIIGGQRFYDRMEIKDVLAYLCVIRNPNDDLRLKRIINNPARGISDKTVEILSELASREGCSIFEMAKRAGEIPQLNSRAIKSLENFVRLVDELSQAVRAMTLCTFYDLLLESTEYAEQYKLKTDKEALERLEYIDALRTNIIEYEERGGEDVSLESFLDEISLFTDVEYYDENADAVVMMTIHSAKGLEFPVVFLTGAEEGIFPSEKSVYGTEEDIEEERRLCYVAITRAKKKLYITCAESRRMFGMSTSHKVSRFVEEIGEQYIEGLNTNTFYKRAVKYDDYGEFYVPMKKYTKTELNSKSNIAPSTGNVKVPSYRVGQAVEHKSFGRGMITLVKPMGGDALIEVMFDTSGTKKFMAKAVTKFIKLL